MSKIDELNLRTTIMKAILLTKKQPSLNIGPGMGQLEKLLPPSNLKISIDLKTYFLKYLIGIENMHLVNAVAEYMPFRDKSLPTITTQSTFQVMFDQKKFLKELHRTLKNNGSFIITIEYGYTYDLESQQFKFSINPEHNDIISLIEYINSLGLNVLEYKYLNLNGSWSNNIEKGFSLWIIGVNRCI